jgi:hypothetical protein
LKTRNSGRLSLSVAQIAALEPWMTSPDVIGDRNYARRRPSGCRSGFRGRGWSDFCGRIRYPPNDLRGMRLRPRKRDHPPATDP